MINDQSPFAKQTQPFKAIALSARDSPAREKPHAAKAGLRRRGRSSVFCQFLCFSCKTYEIIHIHTFQLFTPRVSLPRKEGKKRVETFFKHYWWALLKCNIGRVWIFLAYFSLVWERCSLSLYQKKANVACRRFSSLHSSHFCAKCSTSFGILWMFLPTHLSVLFSSRKRNFFSFLSHLKNEG